MKFRIVLTALATFYSAVSGSLLAETLPLPMSQPLPSALGVGAYAHLTRFGAEPVLIDLGCAIRTSATAGLRFVVNDKDAALIAESSGRMMEGFRLPNLLNPAAPNMIAVTGTPETSQYITFFQHIGVGGIEIEADAPLTNMGGDIGKNLQGLGLLWVTSDGKFNSDGPPLAGMAESIASRCVRPNPSGGGEAPNNLSGYAIYKRQPDLTPMTSAPAQDQRIGAMLSTRANVTLLEKQSQALPPGEVAERARYVKTEIGLAQMADSEDLEKTEANIDDLIDAANKKQRYMSAYQALRGASSAANPKVALSLSSQAAKTLLSLTDYGNAGDLEKAALAMKDQAQKAIDDTARSQLRAQRLAQEHEAAATAQKRLRQQTEAEQESADAAAEDRAATDRLKRAASRYPAQLSALILRFGKLPDAIGNGPYQGHTVVTWQYGTSTYLIENGVILGRQ